MKDIYENLSQAAVVTGRRHRDEIELLRGRLKLLTGRDKILMTMYMEKGISIRQIARLLGTTESKIARRMRISRLSACPREVHTEPVEHCEGLFPFGHVD